MSLPRSRTGRRHSTPPPADPPAAGKKQAAAAAVPVRRVGGRNGGKDLGFSRDSELIYRPDSGEMEAAR
jgi:hypothetical protein